jgi:hypothetical protein
MLGRRANTDELRRGDRVIAVDNLKEIPEGSLGTVKMVVGQAWVRYLVKWDTGDWMGTVPGDKVVRQDRLELYRARRAAEAERAATAAAATPTEAAAASEEGGGRVPEHLLARSRSARARLEGAQAS